jgi:hypothetical protein
MQWTIEYYEQADGVQPAELFEDALDRTNPKLAGKLILIADELEQWGPRLGGGYIEPCHNFAGLWEMRGIHNKWLGRELFGFDNARIIFLHGYVKRTGEEASRKDLAKAMTFWQDYIKSRRVSPVEEEQDESVSTTPPEASATT